MRLKALFQLDNLPRWLKVLMMVNPLTYGVDAPRGVLINYNAFFLWFDFTVLLVFFAATLALGAYTFNKMKL